MSTSCQSFVSCLIHQRHHLSDTEPGGRVANTPLQSEESASSLRMETQITLSDLFSLWFL
jgi:hypothetical protein